MKKAIIATTFALALSTTFAAAQPSSGQGGAATSPTSNSANSMNNGTTTNQMDKNSATTGSSMTKPGTMGTGMSGSSATTNPNQAPGTGAGTAGTK